MESLAVNGICKKYGSFHALNGVSFNVNEGEIFGLLGPNGAGKSTLIKILTGFENPNSGSFSYSSGGKSLYGNGIKEKVSIVPQNLCFYMDFSVEKNLAVMGALYGLRGKKMRERTDALIKNWGLEKFRKKKATHLSGGYKRLLNIACGLVNDPSIIFFDEPTIGLDPKIRKMFWKKIIELKKAGKTIVLTTHYMDEAEYLCETVAMIVNGRILLNFAVEDLKKEGVSLEDIFIELVEQQGIKREDI